MPGFLVHGLAAASLLRAHLVSGDVSCSAWQIPDAHDLYPPDIPFAQRVKLPRLPEAGFRIALDHFRSASAAGDARGAKHWEQIVLDQGNNFPPLYAVLAKGWMSLRFQHTPHAVWQLERFLGLHPDHVDLPLLSNLAIMQAELGRIPQAISTRRRAVELALATHASESPTVLLTQVQLALALLHLGHEPAHVDEAHRVLTSTLAVNVDEVQTDIHMGELRRGTLAALEHSNDLKAYRNNNHNNKQPRSDLGKLRPVARHVLPCLSPDTDSAAWKDDLLAALQTHAKRPLVLVSPPGCTSALSLLGWGLAEEWTLDTLSAAQGNEWIFAMQRAAVGTDAPREADIAPGYAGPLSLFGFSFQRRLMQFGALVDKLQNDIATQASYPTVYMASQGKAGVVYQPPLLGALAQAVPVPRFCAHRKLGTVGMWLGVASVYDESTHTAKATPTVLPPTTTSSRLHHDSRDNIVGVLRGTKRYTMFPPQLAPRLRTFGQVGMALDSGAIVYANDVKRQQQSNYKDIGTANQLGLGEHFSDIDARYMHEHADQGYLAVVDAGNMLVLPKGWFHQAESFGAETSECYEGRDCSLGEHLAVNMWFE